MGRRLIVRLSVVFILVATVVLALAVGAGTAPAANGPAYCGALNMLHDSTMLTIPMARNNPNGNTGMFTAVDRSCP